MARAPSQRSEQQGPLLAIHLCRQRLLMQRLLMIPLPARQASPAHSPCRLDRPMGRPRRAARTAPRQLPPESQLPTPVHRGNRTAQTRLSTKWAGRWTRACAHSGGRGSSICRRPVSSQVRGHICVSIGPPHRHNNRASTGDRMAHTRVQDRECIRVTADHCRVRGMAARARRHHSAASRGSKGQGAAIAVVGIRRVRMAISCQAMESQATGHRDMPASTTGQAASVCQHPGRRRSP
jgi:hypothetical protein